MPVIGFLHPVRPKQTQNSSPASAKGSAEAGYVEGRNVAIEYRWAHGESDRLPELAADLVSQAVTVIVTPGGVSAALAAKAATATIPIVFVTRSDPVPARPCRQPQPARRQCHRHHLHEFGACGKAARAFASTLAPRRAPCGAGQSQQSPRPDSCSRMCRRRLRPWGSSSTSSPPRPDREITPAFNDLVQKRADALLISPDPLVRQPSACNWRRWRRVMRCRRSMPFASLPKPAG